MGKILPRYKNVNSIKNNNEESKMLSTYQESVIVPPQELNDDLITVAIKDDELPDVVLKAILLGLSEEQQALKKVREKKQNEDKDGSIYAVRRGTLLKYMSDALNQRQSLTNNTGNLDIKSAKFREIIKMFLNIIRDTFDEVQIPIEYRDRFFVALARNLDGWEFKIEKILKVMG